MNRPDRPDFPGRKCTVCDKLIDVSTHPIKEDARPEPGDVSLCLYCGNATIYAADGVTLREPTAEEAAQIARDPEIAMYQQARANVMHKVKQ